MLGCLRWVWSPNSLFPRIDVPDVAPRPPAPPPRHQGGGFVVGASVSRARERLCVRGALAERWGGNEARGEPGCGVADAHLGRPLRCAGDFNPAGAPDKLPGRSRAERGSINPSSGLDLRQQLASEMSEFGASGIVICLCHTARDAPRVVRCERSDRDLRRAPRVGEHPARQRSWPGSAAVSRSHSRHTQSAIIALVAKIPQVVANERGATTHARDRFSDRLRDRFQTCRA